MNTIQKRSLHQLYSRPILFVGLLLLLAGAWCYTQMQTNLFPEVLFPRITVIADAGQQPVDRMMITVTKPLESAVKKVQGTTVVKSSTSRGSCVIDVYFKWGLDIYALKTQLESRINEIKGFLPDGTVISTEAMNQSLFPVYGFTLESKTHSRIALRDVGNLVVRPMFSQVDGISNVVVRGGKAKEFVVKPDAAKMTALGITPAQIKTAFAQTNYVLGNGNVADYNRLYLTLTDTRINDMEELRNVIVRNDGKRIVRLGDIAVVEIQEQQEFLKINADGNDAVLVDLVKQPGVNLIDFAKQVESKADEIRQQLPAGYELKPYYNQSAFVGDSIHSVLKTIYEGLFLAIVVMVLFLRSWRSSLVVMLTIPVTVAFSVLLCYLAGITINVMSLGAMAASVGLIIDDAIVVIEQIYREHEERPGTDRFSVVRHAIRNLFPAMVASSLSTIVIHFPFRLMSGLAGSFFKELSDTMQLTLVASFLVTWLLLPVLHLVIGYRKQLRPKDLDVKTLEENSIRKVHFLTVVYRKPLVAAGFVLLLGLGGWYASSRLSSGFLPDLDEGTIVLDYHSPAGTDIEETDRLCRQMERIIMAHPDVETYSRRTALGMSFKTRPSNFGDYLIQLKTDRKASTPEVISDLRREISQAVPLMTIGFGQRIADLLGDLMSTAQPVEVKIFGNDYETLQKMAAQAEKVMEAVPGIVDIDNGLIPAGASIVFTPNQERLSQFGISLTDFSGTAYGTYGRRSPLPACQYDRAEPCAGSHDGRSANRFRSGRRTDAPHPAPFHGLRGQLSRTAGTAARIPTRRQHPSARLLLRRACHSGRDRAAARGPEEQYHPDRPAGEPGFGQCDSRLASVSRCAASSSGRLQYFLRRSLFRTAAVLPRTDDDSLARCLAGVRRIDVPFPRMADLAYRVVHFRTGYLRMSAGFVADGRSAQRKQLHGHHHGGGHHCRKRHLHRMAIPDEPPHGWRCVRSCRLRHRPAHPSQTDDGYRRRTRPDAIGTRYRPRCTDAATVGGGRHWRVYRRLALAVVSIAEYHAVNL